MPHPGLLPSVMSFMASKPVEYNHGFRKPRLDFPALMRASLSIETIAAKAGVEVEVPPTPVREWPP